MNYTNLPRKHYLNNKRLVLHKRVLAERILLIWCYVFPASLFLFGAFSGEFDSPEDWLKFFLLVIPVFIVMGFCAYSEVFACYICLDLVAEKLIVKESLLRPTRVYHLQGVKSISVSECTIRDMVRYPAIFIHLFSSTVEINSWCSFNYRTFYASPKRQGLRFMRFADKFNQMLDMYHKNANR